MHKIEFKELAINRGKPVGEVKDRKRKLKETMKRMKMSNDPVFWLLPKIRLFANC